MINPRPKLIIDYLPPWERCWAPAEVELPYLFHGLHVRKDMAAGAPLEVDPEQVASSCVCATCLHCTVEVTSLEASLGHQNTGKVYLGKLVMSFLGFAHHSQAFPAISEGGCPTSGGRTPTLRTGGYVPCCPNFGRPAKPELS